MNSTQKKALYVALLLATGSSLTPLHAMEADLVDVPPVVEIVDDPVDLPPGADLGAPDAVPAVGLGARLRNKIAGAAYATQDRWNTMGRPAKAATVVGGVAAAGFVGYKAYKWYKKPATKAAQEVVWETGFIDFINAVDPINAFAPSGEDALILQSLISEATETLRPELLLNHEMFVGLLTPEQKAELQAICQLAEASKKAELEATANR